MSLAERMFAEADRLHTELQVILGEEQAEAIYNVVKAEANPYSIVEEINRMCDLVSLAAAGVEFNALMFIAANKTERFMSWLVTVADVREINRLLRVKE